MMAGIRDLLLGRKKPNPLPTPAEVDDAFARQDFTSALNLTRRRADEGDVAAMYRLGEIFEHGLGVLQDFAQALEWYEKAAEAGLEEAWAKLGDFNFAGRGPRSDKNASGGPAGGRRLIDMLSVQPDHDKAAYWNRRAADAGHPGGQALLALQHVFGLGVPPDRREAERLFLAAADRGSVIAQRGLGMLYSGSGDEAARYDQAERWFREASEGGDPAACTALAMLIVNGQATSGTDEDAFRLLSIAADEGHVEAMLYLGSLYRDGKGTDRDLSAAETWFRRASVRGNRSATLSLGFLLIEAIEPHDYVSGASVFREAAEQGDPVGQYVLGKLYLAGLGVPPDDEKAFGWLNQAAEQDLLPAIEALAALHAGGRGVAADPMIASRLFERAAKAGSVDAPYHQAMLALATPLSGTGDEDIVTLLEESATRGSAAACIQLGILHAGSNRVEQDYGRAAIWYAKAVDLGSSDALFNLAFLRLQNLDPAPADTRNGVALLEEAAAQGNRAALWALHNIYREGEYVPADPAMSDRWLVEAARYGSGAAAARLAERLDGPDLAGAAKGEIVDWLHQAAEQGETEAQVRLGLLLDQGKHVPQDAEAAFRWMHSAAAAGHPFAQAWTGDVLFRGQGVIRDQALARKWYERAAEQGHEGARAALGAM